MFITGLLLAASLIADSPRDTVMRESIAREIATLVRIDTVPGPDGRPARVVGFAVDSVRQTPLLAPFLRAHGRMVWYLAAHTPGAAARLVGERDDPLAVRDSVIAVLRSNAAFNDRVLGMLTQYWRGRGRVIEGVATSPASSISAVQLRRIGARFFYPDRMSVTGDTLFTHICAGINGVSDLPESVDPLVEAFVFVAVNSAIFLPKSQLMRSFEVASRRAKQTSVSKDSKTRILRAQGALWSELERSAALGRALDDAYALQRPVLPFRIARAP